jgi:hypothetical protein
MPDFAMCANATCPARNSCRRHAASGTAPGYRQSYMEFSPCDGRFHCASYDPLTAAPQSRDWRRDRRADKSENMLTSDGLSLNILSISGARRADR